MKKTALTVGLVLTIAGSAQAQEFYNLGAGFTPTSISDNGVVAGTSDALGQYFTWSSGDGVTGIGGTLPGAGGQASISADGTRIAGTALNTMTGLNEMGYYDTNTGNWTLLGGIGGSSDSSTSSGWGMSGNGQSVVGLGWVNAGNAHAIQWTEGGLTVDMGSTVMDRSSRANATDFDGNVVVGWQDNEFGGRQGAVWVDGVQTTIFDNNGWEVGEAMAVSADGQWVTGSADGLSAYRYNTFTGAFDYTDPVAGDFFFPSSYAGDISDDGQTIIGAVGGFGPPVFREGFVWREGQGTMGLGEFLASEGVVFEDGFRFFGPFAMSGDGNSFAGWGQDASGAVVGWVATVPAPSGLLALGMGSLVAVRRRR